VKLTRNAQAALAAGDSENKIFEMTPERREKYKVLTAKIVDLLKAETEGPVEGYMVIQFVMHAFEGCYGIRGGIIFEKSDEKRA
jgi:hypothetical protein